MKLLNPERTLEQKIEAGAPGSRFWPYTERPRRSELLAADAARLIHERLLDVHSVSQVGALLGVSREHLSRTFKRHLGCSVWAFMTALRIERSKELLRGSMLVKQVAKEVGFRSDSSFGRAFVRSVGMQPAQYRRTVRANEYIDGNSGSTDRRHS
jgi:transcriptional regulator GlxA family with amidase domain